MRESLEEAMGLTAGAEYCRDGRLEADSKPMWTQMRRPGTSATPCQSPIASHQLPVTNCHQSPIASRRIAQRGEQLGTTEGRQRWWQSRE